jgi:ATP phosphoribosyltransferase regulatory subunit
MPATPPIKATEAALLYDLLSLEAPAAACADAPARDHPDAARHRPGGGPVCGPAGGAGGAGGGCATLAFEASHGRTALEYYDGFVFSFLADGMPPVASGGRYDALTAVLGRGPSSRRSAA